MNTLFIPTESDFKKWIREAVRECFDESLLKEAAKENRDEKLLNRKEVAKVLRISLVTLTDWMKRGLPFHKQRGRVYFVESEVLEYIKRHSFKRHRFIQQVEGEINK
ncbi:MAG: DNA-binding protein [Sphingobacteriales bacterium]|nr:MAG: DNA-binding protein [Sphingobacteriales bacterium]